MPAPKPAPSPAAPTPPSGDSAASRRRLWLFRGLAALALPLAVVALLELALRVAGYGVSSSFLKHDRLGDRDVFLPNPHVAERFFGRDMARQPQAFIVDREKPSDTLRIVVFGESAAFGDPDPKFGLPRMLRVLLEERFPGTRFEVVNAALTGINSHAVLAIARDCLALEADAWVVYMGNNEVVGPFGAGTVFGPQVPPLPLIRGSLALKATRTGQLLDALKRRISPAPTQRAEWGGMTMFTENRVAEDDPRMASVHAHFERNLRDLLNLASRRKVPVVLSTVAVNLKDCAPFASVHRAGTKPEVLAAWERQFALGRAAEDAGDWDAAAAAFQLAAALDDGHAETVFRLGRCHLAAGRDAEAYACFQKARDRDALRFRCDGKMNDLIRRAAQGRDDVVLADSVRLLDAASPNGAAGAELFHEHVHLRFEGNYLLARSLADQLTALLPTELSRRKTADWISVERCAERLAFHDWNRHEAALQILGRLNDPPFTGQIDHDESLRRVAAELAWSKAGTRPEGLRALLPGYSIADERMPDDWILPGLHAEVLGKLGDANAAMARQKTAVERNPTIGAQWRELGRYQLEAAQPDAAAASLRTALQLDPSDSWAGTALGQVLASQGKFEPAAQAYRETLRARPHFGQAHLGLVTVLENLGRTNEAQEHLAAALRVRVLTPEALAGLARFCHERGRFSEAITNYLDAIRLDPSDAVLHLNLAQALKQAGRRNEAPAHHAEALRLDPTSPDALFLVGLDLARGGKEQEGAARFAEALRLRPDFLEARLNFGVALYNLRRPAESREQFEAALKLDPANALARQFLERLKSGGP